uniref:Uncharacterized protein n=1 Tax=Dolomedes sulfureus TaxID=492288 RepID=A0A0P0D5C6_9ARAC|nr:hypothetical protein [Dolomedes sulfureus]
MWARSRVDTWGTSSAAPLRIPISGIPVHKFSTKMLKELGLRYYTPDVHRAALRPCPFSWQRNLGLKVELSP